MRGILLIIALVLLGLLIGWVSIGQFHDRTTISLETGKIKQDTQEMVEKGRDLSEQAGRDAQDLINKARE